VAAAAAGIACARPHALCCRPKAPTDAVACGAGAAAGRLSRAVLLPPPPRRRCRPRTATDAPALAPQAAERGRKTVTFILARVGDRAHELARCYTMFTLPFKQESASRSPPMFTIADKQSCGMGWDECCVALHAVHVHLVARSQFVCVVPGDEATNGTPLIGRGVCCMQHLTQWRRYIWSSTEHGMLSSMRRAQKS
jgi:hypothetical protein